ncbi:protein kinase domain-containing protein [Ditylenchus destructor]|uniref:Protein kinase domain-containing protein n=1 Tax=Ditylenchus destructor TaxID=166010 RepID=A0AAD4NGA8_9BILA|nr:protein kinase domain-containing protein [Ditylenchus destructor]
MFRVDDLGKIVRGKQQKVKADENYDDYVIDVWTHCPPQSVEIKNRSVYDEYEVLEEIGTGAFGVVHRCVEKATGNTFAAKFVETPNDAAKETVRKEINTMSELRHPSLINLRDAFVYENETVMVYEFMSGGELFEKVSDEKNKTTEEEAINYIRQVCVALSHMHENSYVHLDLKPENIMFTTRKSNQVKLIDFGLTAKLDPRQPVKVTTGTAEFAAPEIALGYPVGFGTDMWSLGVLTYILLSGLSPFGGDDDNETLKNVKACDWNMDDPAFDDISVDAKDFLRKLLVMETANRMTVTQALEHPWLTNRLERVPKHIPSKQYISVRDAIRSKYDAWPEPNPPLGRVSQYSSLRKLRPSEYGIKDVSFDPEDALPRFIMRPCGPNCIPEGDNASFFCKVVSPSALTVTWYKDLVEIRHGSKHLLNNNASDYALTINQAKLEDRGEYVVKAQNSFGSKEERFFLDVLSKPGRANDSEANGSIEFLRQRRSLSTLEVPKITEERSLPFFTFYLRPRLIQKNHQCKLICTVEGNPIPTIEWLKDGSPVDESRAQILFRSGACSMEIFNMRPEDAGTYTCKATNELGEDRTECLVSVQTRSGQSYSPSSSTNYRSSSTRIHQRSRARSIISLEQSQSSTEIRRSSQKYASLFPDLVSSSDVNGTVSNGNGITHNGLHNEENV